MRKLWMVLVLGLFGCPKEEAPPPEAPPPKKAPVAKPAPKPVPVADVRPPMISRTQVVKVTRVEGPGGSGVWMTEGAPVEAKGHYADDAPKDAKPGEYEMTFVSESQGDYPHLIFELDGERYDFGWAENQIEGSGFAIDDKSVLAGKSFVVRWDYRPTTFMCCDGDTTSWVGMKPTILAIRAPMELP